MTSTASRLARHVRATALILLLLMALSPGLASAALSVTLINGSLTTPSGGLWLPGPAGTPGHLWIADGAHVYVCGDAQHMAKDVERALIDIVAAHGARSTNEAVAFVTELKKAGRYQTDVY